LVGGPHVVFTQPGPIADIAYHNKAVVYDLLLKAAAETLITIAADPKHLGARIALRPGNSQRLELTRFGGRFVT
jgi:hypothetical protein